MRKLPGGPACSRNSTTSSRPASRSRLARSPIDRLHDVRAHRPQLDQQQHQHAERWRARPPSQPGGASHASAQRRAAPARRRARAEDPPSRDAQSALIPEAGGAGEEDLPRAAAARRRSSRRRRAHRDRGAALCASAPRMYASRHAPARPRHDQHERHHAGEHGQQLPDPARARARFVRVPPSGSDRAPAPGHAERHRQLEQDDDHHRDAELVEQRQVVVEEAVEREVAAERDEQREQRRAPARSTRGAPPARKAGTASSTATRPTKALG